MFSGGSGEAAFEEYKLARFDRSLDDPRTGPYVSFREGVKGSLVLSSDKAFRSSRDIEAAHVSAMLYLAVVSWLSIHFGKYQLEVAQLERAHVHVPLQKAQS